MLNNFFIEKRLHLEVKISNDTNETLTLYYYLIKSNLMNRWIDLIDRNNETKNKIVYNYKKKFNQIEIDSMIKEFKKTIFIINSMYDRDLEMVKDFDHIKNDKNLLNNLHEEFEIYGERFEELSQKKYINEKLNDSFLLLNNLIHTFEVILRDNENFSCLINFKPFDLFSPLHDEDFFLFSTQMLWGSIYLGYNMLGKNWFNTMLDNDVEVFKRKKIVSQSKFAAECYLNFVNNDNMPSYYNNYNFYNWWNKNSIGDYYEANMTIKDLAFGYIPLGFIYSFKINNEENILITNSTDKDKWNNEVWNKFSKVTELKIIKNNFLKSNFFS